MSDDQCPWCGEEDCERSCTAALAAAVGTCRECGIALMIEDGTACPHCGAPWPHPDNA